MAQPVGGLRVATRPPSEPEELDDEELEDDDEVDGLEVRDSVDDVFPLLSPLVSPPRDVVAPVPHELDPLGL